VRAQASLPRLQLEASQIVLVRAAHLQQNPAFSATPNPARILPATSAEIFSTGKGASKNIT
jgi:hypothetical protein